MAVYGMARVTMRINGYMLMFAMLAGSASAQQPDAVDGAARRAVEPQAAAVTNRLVAPEIDPFVVELPETKEAEDLAPQGPTDKRLEIGYVEAFQPIWLADWPWQTRADGRWVARTEFQSKGAGGLRLKLAGLRGDSRISIRVYDPVGTTVLGPFRATRSLDDGSWWTPTIFGEAIGIELVREDDSLPSEPVRIVEVAYINCKCVFNPGTTLSCHNDVSCFSNWKNNDARAIARVTFISGSSCSTCTCELMNRQPGDFSPIVMTANHCISTQSEANSAEVFWDFETPSCNGAAPNPNTLPRNFGALLLKRRASADTTMIGLYDPPDPNAGPHFYLGWDSASWSSGESATVVHHPKGSFKRISFGDTHGTQNACTVNADTRRVTYTSGTTEQGSSGSPIMDSNRRLRGVLTCGGQGCDINDYYGRFDLAYDHLRYFMGNSYISSPVHVSGAWLGDPGNDGSLEQGNSAFPFNTVHEATYSVREGDTVMIAPGNYNETFRLWRPMRLQASTNGTVRIGK